MIGQQYEIGIECVFLDCVGRFARAHVDKVSCLREIGTRTDRIEAAANAVPGGHDRRHFCDQFDRRMHVGKMLSLSVHRGKESETADDRAQHLHRPRRLREVLHRSDERLGKRAAGAQLAFQLFELVAVGKLAVEQKMDDLFERRIGREIVDVVAAVG